jgi:hypothetical protein
MKPLFGDKRVKSYSHCASWTTADLESDFGGDQAADYLSRQRLDRMDNPDCSLRKQIEPPAHRDNDERDDKGLCEPLTTHVRP